MISASGQLPDPLPGKKGWPWTLEAGTAAASLPASPWPKISVVTPSFNQGRFLEETIRSVLLQDYPNLEYLIIDGGSTDQSLDIIKKYESRLAYWVSEKDRGQTHAINKGWARATGEILAWVNSDDWYQPDAFRIAARHFQSDPNCRWLAGAVDNSWAPGVVIKRFRARPASLPRCFGRKDYSFHQPGVFWRRQLVDAVGPLDESMHYCFDHDFWIHSLLLKFTPVFTDECLAGFRYHPDSKSSLRQHLFLEEDWRVFRRYQAELTPAERAQARRWLWEYEGEAVLASAYGLLAQGRRWDALRCLLSRPGVFAHFKPRKLGLGALYRTLITGRPPGWFHG